MVNASAFAQSAVTPTRRPAVVLRPASADPISLALAEAVGEELSMRHRSHVVWVRALPAGPDAAAEHRETHVFPIAAGAAGGRVRLSAETRDDRLEAEAPEDGWAEAVAAMADGLARAAGGPPALPGAAPRRPGWPAFRALAEGLAGLWAMDDAGSDVAADAFARAAALEPGHPAPHAYEAFRIARDFRRGRGGEKADVDAASRAACGRALAADPADPAALWAAAFANGMLFRAYDDAADLVGRALAADPCRGPALVWGAMFRTYAWDFDGAVELAVRGREFVPAGPLRQTVLFAGALACIHARRDADAVAWADAANALDPRFVNTLRIRAAGLAHLGRIDEARATVARVLGIDPGETLSRSNAVNPLREFPGFVRFVEGLRMAGLPE